MPMNSKSRAPTSRPHSTGSYTDKATHTPAYKETSVRMRVLHPARRSRPKSPLPKNNSRFGHPTPQKGVEVERKWKRGDYTMPGTANAAAGPDHKQDSRGTSWPNPFRSSSLRVTRNKSCSNASSRPRPSTPAAILDSYELLQQLHEYGIFNLIRGGLGATDKLVEAAAAGANTTEAIRAMRNAIILGKMLGSIDPDFLQGISNAVGDTLGNAKAVPSESSWSYCLTFWLHQR